MFRKKRPEDLTVEELRRLLVEKRRATRQDRLEHYRKTGRAVSVVPELESPALGELRSDTASNEPDLDAHPPRRRILDGFLLLVEVLAVVGLVFVLFNGLEIMRELNREVAQALELPTLTPTPIIKAVVLPSGHTPPNAEGGTRFNWDEIPEHLRPLVQSMADVPIPTPSPNQANRIQIPAISVDAPVVQGDGPAQLKKGVGQNITSANPGEIGNVILSAHNDVYGEIFRYLEKLKPGDEIILHTNQRAYTYVVTNTEVVEPTDVQVMNQTSEPMVTLISCYPYMVDTQRIVVRGRLESGNR
ncbi:MAG TPA: class D sortase [Anaerolineales bacterium]|nr:class D sortase [Anaerolineales bacterium]